MLGNLAYVTTWKPVTLDLEILVGIHPTPLLIKIKRHTHTCTYNAFIIALFYNDNGVYLNTKYLMILRLFLFLYVIIVHGYVLKESLS